MAGWHQLLSTPPPATEGAGKGRHDGNRQRGLCRKHKGVPELVPQERIGTGGLVISPRVTT